jgi:uncharacterized protein (DUF362 family)
VQDAVDSLGGIGRFVKKGDKVLVKINICGGVPDKMGTFTSIEVADVVADLILSAGGKPIFADADMIWTKFWPVAKDSGFVNGPGRREWIWSTSPRPGLCASTLARRALWA